MYTHSLNLLNKKQKTPLYPTHKKARHIKEHSNDCKEYITFVQKPRSYLFFITHGSMKVQRKSKQQQGERRTEKCNKINPSLSSYEHEKYISEN